MQLYSLIRKVSLAMLIFSFCNCEDDSPETVTLENIILTGTSTGSITA